jgi:hypothetical protein
MGSFARLRSRARKRTRHTDQSCTKCLRSLGCSAELTEQWARYASGVFNAIVWSQGYQLPVHFYLTEFLRPLLSNERTSNIIHVVVSTSSLALPDSVFTRRDGEFTYFNAPQGLGVFVKPAEPVCSGKLTCSPYMPWPMHRTCIAAMCATCTAWRMPPLPSASQTTACFSKKNSPHCHGVVNDIGSNLFSPIVLPRLAAMASFVARQVWC